MHPQPADQRSARAAAAAAAGPPHPSTPASRQSHRHAPTIALSAVAAQATGHTVAPHFTDMHNKSKAARVFNWGTCFAVSDTHHTRLIEMLNYLVAWIPSTRHFDCMTAVCLSWSIDRHVNHILSLYHTHARTHTLPSIRTNSHADWSDECRASSSAVQTVLTRLLVRFFVVF